MSDQSAAEHKPPAQQAQIVYRHRLPTRLTHWVNVLCFAILLMSGLQILNAHPALYWGQDGAQYDKAFISFLAVRENGALVGKTKIGGLTFTTTGLFGASQGTGGMIEPRGMPSWATLPSYRSLASGRRWHFFFAWLFALNGLAYLAFSLGNGHFRKDLLPKRAELGPRHIAGDLWNHLRLRFPKGEAARNYNVLQKLAYLGAILLLILMVLTGLTMSPGVNAALPFMLDVFGGRQSARTLHFVSASLLCAFVVVHLVMVVLAGPLNEVRAMITGRYHLPPEDSA